MLNSIIIAVEIGIVILCSNRRLNFYHSKVYWIAIFAIYQNAIVITKNISGCSN